MKKVTMFDRNIAPMCLYCEHSRQVSGTDNAICIKHGTVNINHSCRSFLYAPLKRIPQKQARLPKYSKDEFTL